MASRPWTPPESEDDMSAQSRIQSQPHPDPHRVESAPELHSLETTDSGYFGEAVHAPGSSASAGPDDIDLRTLSAKEMRNRWPLSATPSPDFPFLFTPSKKPPRREAPAKLHSSRTEPIGLGLEPRPYTPTPKIVPPNLQAQTHEPPPQYPYTPDSARTTLSRNHTFPTVAPLPSMPWSTSLQTQTSPVQNALYSCLSNLEHLIQTSQPNDTQMDHIISQFEAMASYLSAPESQSKPQDDDLFHDLETSLTEPTHHHDHIQTHTDDVHANNMNTSTIAKDYVNEVGKYISGVRTHVDGLKNRLEEIKLLNEIQFDIIQDLRGELRRKYTSPTTTTATATIEKGDEEIEDDDDVEKSQSQPQSQSQSNGFWVSISSALDSVGDLWLEW